MCHNERVCCSERGRVLMRGCVLVGDVFFCDERFNEHYIRVWHRVST